MLRRLFCCCECTYCWSIKKRLEKKLIAFDKSVQEYQAILQKEKEVRAKILNVSMVAVVVVHSKVSALLVGHRPVIVKNDSDWPKRWLAPQRNI